MTAAVSLALFVTADIFMLINIMLFGVCFWDTEIADKKVKVILFSIIHSAYAVVFKGFFHDMQPFAMLLMLFLFYVRFLIFPVLTTRNRILSFFYISLFLLTMQSLIKRTALWIPKNIFEISYLSMLENLPPLIFQISVFFILIMTYRQKLFKNAKTTLRMISKLTWMLILVCFFIMDGLITLLEVDTVKLSLQKGLFQFILILFMLILIVIIASLMISNISKNYYADTSKILEKQIKSQLSYYEQQEASRKEFRAFKHDHVNHMHCIRSLIAENKNKEAVSYIDRLYMSPLFEQRQFDTGNNIVDAILSDKYTNAQKHDIAFTYKGFFTSDFNAVDLCIILSNALDNAIEACSKLEKEKKIQVNMKMQQGYQLLKISNSCNLIHLSENKLPRTTKSNAYEHGYGLLNIQTAVQKNLGKMKISCDNNLFVLEISLPIS